MRRPNLFIVGAAKAGTSSLFHSLGRHPDVFAPILKEPHYFSSVEIPTVKSYEQYLQLFAQATNEKLVCEASASYLYDIDAAKRIAEWSPTARIIISLRNPADRAYSLWSHLYNRRQEHLEFDDAIAQEQERIKSDYFIKTSDVHHMYYHYVESGKYSTQIARFWEAFPEQQIKILLFEEIIEHSNDVYQELWDFLEIDPLPHLDTVHRNPRRSDRFPLIRNFLTRNRPRIIDKLFEHASPRLRLSLIRAGRGIMDWNLRETEMLPMNENTKSYILNECYTDVRTLESMIDRSLEKWYPKNKIP